MRLRILVLSHILVSTRCISQVLYQYSLFSPFRVLVAKLSGLAAPSSLVTTASASAAMSHHCFDYSFSNGHLTTQAIDFGFGLTGGFSRRVLLSFITHVNILHYDGTSSGSVFYSESSNGFSSLVISTELSSAVRSFSIGSAFISMFPLYSASFPYRAAPPSP